MQFITAGRKQNPAILFFHAMGVTGESSEAVAEGLKKDYFVSVGQGLDYTSLKNMMRDCLTEDPFPVIDEQMQKNMILEFGSLEDHFKYRDAVMQAYPKACFPIFKDMNHMQIQIRHPKEFAGLLRRMMEEPDLPLQTREYNEKELIEGSFT